MQREVWTWGSNNHGQLGIGNTNNQLQPVKVAIDKSFMAIAAGDYHSLANYRWRKKLKNSLRKLQIS